MSISLIVAMDRQRLIGRDGGLPWRLPDDLAHFKQLTLNKTILMGRKTWDSLGRPLPQRDNWVLSRDPAWSAPGARAFTQLDHALAAAESDAKGELMVIGGAQLYRQTLAVAQRIYLTEVDVAIGDGDAWFPELDRGDWQERHSQVHAADQRHAHAFRFVTLERRSA